MFRDAKTGFQHSIPITTNFKILKYFSVTMGTAYNEVWAFNTIQKYFSTIENKVVTSAVSFIIRQLYIINYLKSKGLDYSPVLINFVPSILIFCICWVRYWWNISKFYFIKYPRWVRRG